MLVIQVLVLWQAEIHTGWGTHLSGPRDFGEGVDMHTMTSTDWNSERDSILQVYQ